MENLVNQVINVFRALERAFRYADPMQLALTRQELLVHEHGLRSSRDAAAASSHVEQFHDQAVLAATLALEALDLYGTGQDINQAFMNVLKAYRKFARAQEALFPLRDLLAQVDGYFLEPGTPPRSGSLKQDAHTGIFHEGSADKAYERGGYSLYVPDTYDPQHAWPLVIAFHGGYGHGKDFLWHWVREARTRGFILFSPTSTGRTWSILDPDQDAGPLLKHLEHIRSVYRIDPSRILGTGMSDGATFALVLSLRASSPFNAVAPVSGVLAVTDLSRAKGRRIYWVHGALDWMFRVDRAIQACSMLKNAGAEVKLKVVRDLSHAYPREENSGILEWFFSGP